MRLVITGTSSGIGQHLAQELAAQGHDVWGLARSPQTAKFFTSRCDVAEWAQVERAAATVRAQWPQIDGLICAAAIQGAVGAAMDADPEVWSRTVRTNLDGTYFAIRAFWPLLGDCEMNHQAKRRPANNPDHPNERLPHSGDSRDSLALTSQSLSASARHAKIICFSGGGATKARPNFSAYAASKTGVVRLVENLAVEWTGLPVDINAIAPGAINTAMTQETVRLGAELAGRAEFEAAQKQLASGGQSIAKATGLVEFLLSEKSDGITGRLLAAQWDDWAGLPTHAATLGPSEIYQLRRILPEERGTKF